jgi:hypothetical protein
MIKTKHVAIIGLALVFLMAVPMLALLSSSGAVVYKPENWNGPLVIDKNNCYNYACNWQDDSFAQPGMAGGYTPSEISCEEYIEASEADGLTQVDCEEECPPGSHKSMLVVAPGTDFHWYREDADGSWSHKPGETEATNKDATGEPISDPRDADRGIYTEVCACFCDGPEVTKVGHLPTRTPGPSRPDPTATPTPTPSGTSPTPTPSPTPSAEPPTLTPSATPSPRPSMTSLPATATSVSPSTLEPNESEEGGLMPRAPEEASVPSIAVSLIVFSGLPDLGWQITDSDDISTLIDLLQDLPSADEPDWPQFWWRGFMLRNNNVSEFPLLVRVFEGTIQIFDEQGDQYFQDVNGLEDWLMANMPDFDGDGLSILRGIED